MSSPNDQENISNLLTTDEEYAAPKLVADAARQQDWAGEMTRSIEDAEKFWSDYARRFEWSKTWDKVFASDGIHHEWFIGGKTNITINALDRHADSERRNRAAYIFLDERGNERIVTYGQLYLSVCRFANGLKSLNVKRGDTVIIYMPLTIEGITAMLACARIGAIHSVVYAGLGHAALRERITDAGAKVVIAADAGYRRGKTISLISIVDDAIQNLDSVERVVVFEREAHNEQRFEDARFVLFDELMKSFSNCPAEEMDAEDALFILYTSGTTGKPKGVVHVHGGYMVGVTYHLENFFDVGERDVFWCTSDIGWIVGHSYIVYANLCGGVTTLFREGAIDFPHAGIAWEIVERYGVNVMFTAPTALRMFMRYGAEHPAKYDLTSLRLIACAGEPLNPEAWRWAQTHLAGDGRWGYVIDNWWQTELGAPTIATPSTCAMRPGKAGIPLPGIEADVVDAEGASCPHGVGGRLVLKRPFPHLMRAVWNDDARYERMWTQVENCYVSGDVAVKDADGYITVLGRADDVLNVAGHRIGTADVESALVSHPSIAEAAVIGIPHDIKGESIKAYVQLRYGFDASDLLAEQLIAHVRHELGAIATIGSLEFVKALPKTRSGKIMRRYLKAQATGTDAGDLSTLEE